jgi:ribosomal protein S18 acetylase RimI-like enzyme
MPIRIGADRDVGPAMHLVRLCIAHMRQNGIEQWDDVYPDETTLRADARAGTMYVIQDSSGICGMFVLNDFQDREYADVPWTITGVPIAVVHRLMVHPAHQRRGIARQLMKAAEARASERGYGAIRLDAFTQNPGALRLYADLGYRDAGGITLRKGLFRCFEKRLP